MADKQSQASWRGPKRIAVPTEMRKMYGTKLVTRAVAAHILGISKSELIRREKDKIYPCITDGDGRKWYDEDTLRNTPPREKKSSKSTKADPTPRESTAARYSGEIASVVFEGLNRGDALDAIVVTKAIHPEAALAIQDAYARVKGGLYIPKGDLELIGRLPFKATKWPPENGKDFLVLLESLLKAQECVRCKAKPSKLCPGCAHEAYGAMEPPPSNGIAYSKPA